MPQAENLVLKNAAGTDKTFTLIAPAAGYGGVAEWALKEGTISSVFPKVTAMARKGASVAGRPPSSIVQQKLRVPSSYTDTVTGLTSVSSAFDFQIHVSVPADFPEALKADAVAYASNLAQNAIIKAMWSDGSAAS